MESRAMRIRVTTTRSLGQPNRYQEGERRSSSPTAAHQPALVWHARPSFNAKPAAATLHVKQNPRRHLQDALIRGLIPALESGARRWR